MLKRLRKQKRITQFQLAEALNISQTSVSKYERGVCQPDLNVVVLMSDYFGISVDELVRGLCAQEAAFRKNKNSGKTQVPFLFFGLPENPFFFGRPALKKYVFNFFLFFFVLRRKGSAFFKFRRSLFCFPPRPYLNFFVKGGC